MQKSEHPVTDMKIGVGMGAMCAGEKGAPGWSFLEARMQA